MQVDLEVTGDDWRVKASVNHPFLDDRPWISPWIKSISNELDLTIHVIVSQLSRYVTSSAVDCDDV